MLNDIDDDLINLPTGTKKSVKRKANEAIVGDTRFKVDAAAGIIIY